MLTSTAQTAATYTAATDAMYLLQADGSASKLSSPLANILNPKGASTTSSNNRDTPVRPGPEADSNDPPATMATHNQPRGLTKILPLLFIADNEAAVFPYGDTFAHGYNRYLLVSVFTVENISFTVENDYLIYLLEIYTTLLTPQAQRQPRENRPWLGN
jgi:hypothetical protein